MDTIEVSTVITALMALPLNGILLLIVITLWRRIQALTTELIECHKSMSEMRLIRANSPRTE